MNIMLENGNLNNIVNFIEDNDMEHTKIQISDGLLKFNKVKHTAPLTFKFLNDQEEPG